MDISLMHFITMKTVFSHMHLLGIGLGRFQEISRSGMYSGPLLYTPSISSRLRIPYVDIVPVIICVAMWHWLPHIDICAPSPCCMSLSPSLSIDQVCSACSTFSQAAVVKASATSAAVISSSPKAMRARRSRVRCSGCLLDQECTRSRRGL
jgi:hypothetical protein